jgi:ribonucleoside-diphosphate reductase alpha chain
MSTNQKQETTLAPNALRVLEKRYLARNDKGQIIETVDDLFRRVACNIAEADLHYAPEIDINSVAEEFYEMMASLRFLPNSPTLMNAGRDLQQLSACFVLPIEDSISGIFDAVKYTAIIHKTGGGTGFSFSRLRPKNDAVRTTGGVSSGPVSFMKVFNHATEAIKQGGTRRGANMGILRVDHPDILEFIRCKADTKEITNFNISVAITDDFMKAEEEDRDYPLINPRTKEIVTHLSARAVFEAIAQEAHRTGEPGIFFIDRANETNPTPDVGEIEATNPCGEQPLLPFESCNLGSINLEKHLLSREGKYRINWPLLKETIRSAVHFLDNVIDQNRYPIKEIEAITKGNRKIGLGVMGFARTLFKLGIPYDSEEGLNAGRAIMSFIRRAGYDKSAEMAGLRGLYPNWKGSLHEKQEKTPRHSYVTTVAPTGTISMIADTSGGCEPEFSLIWHKNVMEGDQLPYVLDYFIEVARREGFWTDDLLDRIVKNNGSVQGIYQVPAQWQRIFVTSHEISPEWHVRMQAAFQEFSDSAVSKTINLPANASVESVKEAYRLAYQLRCKGITIYRDGARPDQVMNVGSSPTNGYVLPSNDTRPVSGTLRWGDTLELPDVMEEVRVRVKTADGHVYLHVGFHEGEPREIFVNPGFGKFQGMLLLVGRLASDILRYGGDLNRVLHHFERSHRECPDISVPIHAMMKGLQKIMEQRKIPVLITEPCPECRAPMRMQEGCMVCTCGYSRC